MMRITLTPFSSIIYSPINLCVLYCSFQSNSEIEFSSDNNNKTIINHRHLTSFHWRRGSIGSGGNRATPHQQQRSTGGIPTRSSQRADPLATVIRLNALVIRRFDITASFICSLHGNRLETSLHARASAAPHHHVGWLASRTLHCSCISARTTTSSSGHFGGAQWTRTETRSTLRTHIGTSSKRDQPSYAGPSHTRRSVQHNRWHAP